jgi:hypothetical protein
MTLKKLLDNGWVRFGIGFCAMYSFDVFFDFILPSTSDSGDRIGDALFGGIMIWSIGAWQSETSEKLSNKENKVTDV